MVSTEDPLVCTQSEDSVVAAALIVSFFDWPDLRNLCVPVLLSAVADKLFLVGVSSSSSPLDDTIQSE